MADSETREQAREGVEEARKEAGDIGRDFRMAAEERAGRWTEQASRQASSLAHALSAARDDLDQQGERSFARWSESAAEEVDKMAGYLEKNDPRGILRDVHELAHRNPAAFLGGTFAAGLLLGRFLRSSDPDRGGTLPEARRSGS